MSEFGHEGHALGGGGFIDCWGVGPFVIEAHGKTWRFEDSDRFGPVLLNKDDSVKETQPGERSPFWRVCGLWIKQGRRTKDDNMTCIWDEPDAFTPA